jgi:outer membrane lipoprotein-sorting protein
MRRYILILLLLAIFPVLGTAQAQDEKARQIFEEVDQRRSSVTSETAEMQMIIYNSSGATRKRTIQSYSFNQNDNSKSLLIFKDPANVQGTAFLNVSEGNDEMQKLYLPALGRIQTISAAQKSDRFMGSDFTYEDLGDQNPDDYTFSLEAETDTAFVLYAEKEGSTQYDHFRFYIHPEMYTPTRVEYYNEDDEMIKKLVAQDFEKLGDQLWQPSQMTMYDLKNNRRTELIWQDRDTGTSIPQWRFTERGLRRGL